ncbi:MAG: C40 family peptidase [Bacillota bacterium]
MPVHSRRKPAAVLIGGCLLFLLLAGFLCLYSGAKVAPENFTLHLNELEKRYAPDKRLAIFEIEYTLNQGQLRIWGKVSDEVVRRAVLNLGRRGAGIRRFSENIVVLPVEGPDGVRQAVVASAVLDVWPSPGQTGQRDRMTQALHGQLVTLLDQSGNWQRVRLPDGYIGWVDHSALVPLTGRQAAEWMGAGISMVIKPAAQVLSLPRSSALVVRELPFGALVKTGAGQQGFLRASTAQGQAGWIAASSLKVGRSLEELRQSREGFGVISQRALAMQGVPYLWGGSSPEGYDCSGFIQAIMASAGVALPRDTDLQYAVGVEIKSAAHLAPGDLVFFSTYRSGPSHVGLYLGEGRFIHCGDRGVAINSLIPGTPGYSAYLASRFIGGRRIP